MKTTAFSNLDGVVVSASESDCLADAPDPYRSLMHNLHFLTIPLYTLAIYVLLFKTPSSLREYRKLLLWHTMGNLIFEVYISVFMLPVTYLPLIVFRGAGILKYWNISGVVQFYMLVAALVHTGLSVMELFKYRFDATISEETFNKKLLHKIVQFFWLVAIFIPIIGFCTSPICIPDQYEYKQDMWKANPSVSIQIVCHTSVTAPPLIHHVFTPLMILIITTITTAVVIVPHTTITILARLEQLSKHLSRRTIELQRMLLISLFIQAFIHGIMLGIPIVTFVYAVLFSLNNNDLAYTLIILISFHGSISTIAMIGFTKPIRIGVFELICKVIPYCSPKASTLVTPSPELTFDRRNSHYSSQRSTGY